MESASNPRREKRRTFMSAVGIVLAIMVLAPPIVYAAAQKVNVVKSVPIGLKAGTSVGVKNLNGAVSPGQQNGVLPSENLPKSVNANIVAGGDGFWGVGVCEHPSGAAAQTVTVPRDADTTDNVENVVTGVIIGSPDAATVTIAAPDLPGGPGDNPILIFRTSAEQPSQAIDLPTGLKVSPSELVFRCQSGGDPSTNPATFVVLGH